MKRGAILLDIDGTVVDSPAQKVPSARLVRAIQALEPEYYICAATGRVRSHAKPVLDALGLRDPCIITDGTQLYDPVSGKILWQLGLSEHAVNQALAILRQHNRCTILTNNYEEDDYLEDRGILPSEFQPSEPIYFLEYCYIPEAESEALQAKLEQIPGVTCTRVVALRPGMKDLHIINERATKEHAVAELLARLQVDRQDVIGVGDGHNDIHLFRAVGRKIAMGNAVPELQAMADEVIGRVEADGLAIFLEKLAQHLEAIDA